METLCYRGCSQGREGKKTDAARSAVAFGSRQTSLGILLALEGFTAHSLPENFFDARARADRIRLLVWMILAAALALAFVLIDWCSVGSFRRTTYMSSPVNLAFECAVR